MWEMNPGGREKKKPGHCFTHCKATYNNFLPCSRKCSLKCKSHCHNDTPQFQLFWACARSAIKYLTVVESYYLTLLNFVKMCKWFYTIQEQEYKQINDADVLVLETGIPVKYF